jgi:DNA-binding transcriptional LysR family regulator
MDLRQLEYFVAVAEEQNFTRAAARVHISQSGVSAQIRQLERELGAALLDRTGRTATLTAAGAAALGHARAALAAAAAVRQAVDEVNGLVRGRLTVGMVTACTVTPLFDALASFRSDHPGVELTLLEDTSDRLVDRIRTGGADLALIGAAGAAPAGLEALQVVSEPLVAAVPHGHPLAVRPWLRLEDLAGHPLVCLPQGTGVRAVFDQACAERAVRPQVALQAGAPAAVADLAARGLGVAVLSESMAATAKAGLVALPLQDVGAPAVLALVWKASADPALRELVRHCRRTFAPADGAGGQPG